MIERITSGNARLDAVLGGGLPSDAVNLVVGSPGTGKTMLVQKYVFANGTDERPAIYFSTVSEPLDKLVRYGQSLSFFDTTRIGRSVFYEDLGQVVSRGGVQAVLQAIQDAVRRRRPGVVVIDSFRALRAYAGDEEFRSFLHDLAGFASAFPASHFWIGEYQRSDIATAPEFAVADSIIALASSGDDQRERRELEVVKLRGSGFLSGRHAYRLDADGIDVFPRLADPVDISGYELDAMRKSTGVAALDALLGDGYLPGSSILVAGPTGTGKSLMGLHFVFAGAAAGEPAIVASLQEDELQLERAAAGFGWTLTNSDVTVIHSPPVDLYVDEWVYRLLDEIDRTGARRIVIDSVSDLSYAVPDPIRFREYLYSLIARCARSGVSVMMTLELRDLFEVRSLGTENVSHLADSVVLLQYLQGAEKMRRAVTLLKSRATSHEPEVREYAITSNGIVLRDA